MAPKKPMTEAELNRASAFLKVGSVMGVIGTSYFLLHITLTNLLLVTAGFVFLTTATYRNWETSKDKRPPSKFDKLGYCVLSSFLFVGTYLFIWMIVDVLF